VSMGSAIWQFVSVFLLMVLAAILAFVWIGVRSRLQRREWRRHQETLAAWATANGYGYQVRSPALTRAWEGVPFVSHSAETALDVITGRTRSGQPFCSFEYRYVVGNGKNREIVRIWIMSLRLPCSLPGLTVTEEGLGSKIAQFFGGQDIKLESDDFNQAFRVQSESQAFAYAILNPRTIEWLLGQGRSVAPFRLVGSDLLCWQDGEQNHLGIGSRLGMMNDLLRQIPEFVWKDYGTPTPEPPRA